MNKNKIMQALVNRLLVSSLFSAVILAISGGAAAQGRLNISEVKDGLHVIMGPGGNIGVRLTPEGVILIDNKFPQDFEEIQSLVAEVTDLPVRYVINTHHHGDHSGSNPGFLQFAEVIAHKNARENMLRGNQEGLPRIIYTDETAVSLGGIEVRVFHMGSGHTNGDSVVYFPDLKTIHGGDLLHGIAPFIDYGNGGSSRGWVRTVNNILTLDFNTAIPGHGEIMDRRDVLNFRNQMEAIRARMTSLIRDGVNISDVSNQIIDPDLSWTQIEDGLFMQRSIPGFFNEILEEIR
ncbi:MAG: MBL fold metallo-hydrolase [Pseudohongiellaceae bacterium]